MMNRNGRCIRRSRAPRHSRGKLSFDHFIIPPEPHRDRLAILLIGMAMLGTTQAAHAQACTVNSTNNGILQNGGTCVQSGPVTTGFGNAVAVSNSADVTLTSAAPVV